MEDRNIYAARLTGKEEIITCTECEGVGFLLQTKVKSDGHITNRHKVTCSGCNNSGRQIRKTEITIRPYEQEK